MAKRSEYFLKAPVDYAPSSWSQDKAVTFPAGTMIHPIWNPLYLPAHLRKLLDPEPEAPWSRSTYVPKNGVVCLIGTKWVVVPEKDIEERC